MFIFGLRYISDEEMECVKSEKSEDVSETDRYEAAMKEETEPSMNEAGSSEENIGKETVSVDKGPVSADKEPTEANKELDKDPGKNTITVDSQGVTDIE